MRQAIGQEQPHRPPRRPLHSARDALVHARHQSRTG
jgi:hypothetical protein